jgi:hypothetical protein
MADAKRLTLFQQRMIDFVAEQAQMVNKPVVVEQHGEDEVAVVIFVAGKEVWLYEDEAGLQGDGLDRRFELPDFRDVTDLESTARREIVELLRDKQ